MVEYLNSEFSPDIIVFDPMRVTSGNRFNTMKNYCPYSQRSHLNLLTFFPPRVDAHVFRYVQIFLQTAAVTNTQAFNTVIHTHTKLSKLKNGIMSNNIRAAVIYLPRKPDLYLPLPVKNTYV